VKLGYFVPQMGPAAGPDAISAVARRAEEVGYDSVWVTERTLVPLEPSEPYVATPDGKLPDIYRRVLDPLASLVWAAAHTSSVHVGTSVLNLPWYNATLLARQLTTIDILSGGRLRVGFGLGWSTDEYRAAGTDWRTRGRKADETLEALKAIWTQDPVAFDGEFLSITPSIIGPKPVQKPHPPIYMAAYTEKAMARVARFADAWMPVGVPLEGMQAMLASIRETAASHGRDGDAIALVVRANLFITDAPIEKDRFIFTGTLEQIAEDVAATKAIGASELHFELAFGPTAPTVDDYLSMAGTLHEIGTSA
jgi:probable F420-dependent oxidoreductase